MIYKRKQAAVITVAVVVAVFAGLPALAQEPPDEGAGGQADLAQDLTNPVADLLTIPIQMNYDQNIGPADDGWKLQTNIQPVLPFDLSDDWNLITRTIMPVIWQDEIVPGAGRSSGSATSRSAFRLPEETDERRDLGRRSDPLSPDGHGRAARRPEVGGGALRHRADHARAVDPGRARQPRVVVCRQRPSGRPQQHLRAAVPGVHDAHRLDRLVPVRDHLQLGYPESGRCRSTWRLPSW